MASSGAGGVGRGGESKRFSATVNAAPARRRNASVAAAGGLEGLRALLNSAEASRRPACRAAGQPAFAAAAAVAAPPAVAGLRLKRRDGAAAAVGGTASGGGLSGPRNRGVDRRAAADEAARLAVRRPAVESALERKAALYDALHAAGGVGEEADDYNDPRYMVDFLRKGDKGEGPRRHTRSRSRSRSFSPPRADPMEQLERREDQRRAGEEEEARSRRRWQQLERERDEARRALARGGGAGGGGLVPRSKAAKRRRLLWERELAEMERERSDYQAGRGGMR